MFCAEDRERSGEAHVSQRHDLVDTTSLYKIVLRGYHSNRKQNKARGAHRQGCARECNENGENSQLHSQVQKQG